MELPNLGDSMKRLITVLAGIAVWGLLSTVEAQNSTSASKTTPPQPSPTAGLTYVIGADDMLLVSVWKEPDLTNTLPVRADGMISLPLLNDVQAAGLTPMQLANSITEKLKKYVSDPHVTVVVTQMNSKRIYAMGEVLKPGPMNLLPDMTVLQALSATGFTQFANTKGIYVLRNEGGKQTKIPINYKKLIKGEEMDQNLVLKPGDTIVVP